MGRSTGLGATPPWPSVVCLEPASDTPLPSVALPALCGGEKRWREAGLLLFWGSGSGQARPAMWEPSAVCPGIYLRCRVKGMFVEPPWGERSAPSFALSVSRGKVWAGWG